MTLHELQRLDAENELDEPLNPEEMYVWVPPGDAELALRRSRQAKLDAVSRDVDNLILNFLSVQEEGAALENSVVQTNSRVNSIDENILAKAKQIKDKNNRLERDTVRLKASVRKAGSDVRELDKARAARAAAARTVRTASASYKGHYRKAIRLFRQGEYTASIKRFKQAFSGNPPRSLKDNIYFGIGSAYYKLKLYPAAIKHLDAVVKEYPRQDKWIAAHVMLGMIYGLDGQKSNSIYILEKALDSNPSASIRKVIDRLIAITQEEDFYADL